MNKALSIVIADDDTVFPFGLKLMLLQLNKKHQVRVVLNGQQVIKMLAAEHADLVFIDYRMPMMDCVYAIQVIKNDFPGVKIVVCTYCREPEVVHELVKEGINGYILKETRRNEIEKAVEIIINGGEFYSDEIKKVLQHILAYAISRDKFESEKNKFTKRELEIIQLVCNKYSNTEIANKLFIEVRTVETHLYNIYQESDTHSHSELMRYAENHYLFPSKVLYK